MDLDVGAAKLKELGKLNVIIGKNGIGKSQLLRAIDANLHNQPDSWLIKYISPERGGELAFEPSVEANLRNSLNWGVSVRRRNRVREFRNMSFSEYRNLEVLVLRKRENDANAPSFDHTLGMINALLDHVKLVRGSSTDPQYRRKADGLAQTADTMSSGESELLSLAIEILSFCYQARHEENSQKKKLLLLDEPDVHLHPDLQHRLIKLISEETEKVGVTTIVATHSTAILGALKRGADRIAFMNSANKSDLVFHDITQQLEDILPVFGAHPLTNVFVSFPILLLEGEDDVRIWQQAVRSSQGRLRFWPCPAGDIQSLEHYENTASEIIGAVYDGALAYSLRDRDDKPYPIDDKPNVVRMRLFCRSAENLILSNEVLALLGLDWAELQMRLEMWAQQNSTHTQSKSLEEFLKSRDRMGADVKDLRNLFLVIAGSNKPWEVAVGQAIANLRFKGTMSEGDLSFMLGDKVMAFLLSSKAQHQQSF